MPIHHRRKKGSDKGRVHERLRMVTHRMSAYVWCPGEDEPIKGFSFVADLSAGGAGLYLSKQIKDGSQVRVAFESETSPSFQGTAVWCQRYTLEQHFLGHDMLSFRVGVKFRFASEPERERYTKFLDEVEARLRIINSKMFF
jgi:hypothetical protein